MNDIISPNNRRRYSTIDDTDVSVSPLSNIKSVDRIGDIPVTPGNPHQSSPDKIALAPSRKSNANSPEIKTAVFENRPRASSDTRRTPENSKNSMNNSNKTYNDSSRSLTFDNSKSERFKRSVSASDILNGLDRTIIVNDMREHSINSTSFDHYGPVNESSVHSSDR
eukprot:UN02403